MTDLPPGFVLDQPTAPAGLPPGFVLDQPSVGADVAKSAAIGVPKGLINAAGAGGDARNAAASAMEWIAGKLGASPEKAAAIKEGGLNYGIGSLLPSSGGIQKKVETATGPFYQPQTSAGKIAEAVTSSASNPLSYVGPGTAALKLGGAALSGAAGEGGRQLAEGTPYETAAQLGGNLLGGVTAAKTLGPTGAKAAVPTGRELKDIAGTGYDAALRSGLVLDPKGVGSWATNVEQQLNGKGFTGGKNGTAPKTLGVLSDLQSAPAGSTVGASNIDTVRKTLGNIAKETHPSTGGAFLPTPDAAAASAALERLKSYTENIPQNHILAGDAADYVRNIKEANANYAAGSRAQDFDARLTKAENATDRQVSGSLDSQIKSKAGQMLDNPARMRGMTDAEKAQLQLINSGSPTSNILRQLGRGGAGVIPMGAHIAGAMATGGASIPASLAVGVPLYAARKIAEAMTKGRAGDLVEMLAKRSPEYERRAAAVPQIDNSANKAAIIRAMIGAH